MKNITVCELLQMTGGKLLGNESEEVLSLAVKDIAIDSRIAEKGDLFVAIVGERNDAHKFIPKTMENTDVVLMSKSVEEMEQLLGTSFEMDEKKAYIYVEDTIDGLQKIGAAIRAKYKKPVIGVTGSVGKTTTREMIWTALSSNYPTFKTLKNLNSQIGLPMTVSHLLDEETEAAVIEMGISMPNEMDRLAMVAKPDIAVCTIIGVSHIEFLKSKKGIRDEKLKIASLMDENGILLLNGDDAELSEITPDFFKGKLYFYGTGDGNTFQAKNLRIEDGMQAFDYVHGSVTMPVRISVLGKHNVQNALAGMAVADLLGYDLQLAAKNFEHFQGLRQLVLKAKNGAVMIDDSYNASPDSMKASLNVLDGMDVKGKKIAVLGDMFELGPDERKYHREVGSHFVDLSIDCLITIGNLSKEIGDEASRVNKNISVTHIDSVEEAKDIIEKMLAPEDAILFKASNGMHFSELVKLFL